MDRSIFKWKIHLNEEKLVLMQAEETRKNNQATLAEKLQRENNLKPRGT